MAVKTLYYVWIKKNIQHYIVKSPICNYTISKEHMKVWRICNGHNFTGAIDESEMSPKEEIVNSPVSEFSPSSELQN